MKNEAVDDLIVFMMNVMLCKKMRMCVCVGYQSTSA